MAKINYAHAVVDRSGIALGLDDAMFTSHWRRMIVGSPDIGDMDHTGRDDATSRIADFWTTLTPLLATPYKLREVDWYVVDDAAPHKVTFVETIAVGAGGLGIPGSGGSSVMPHQLAATITFKTAQRKGWGRFYLPGLTNTQYDLSKGMIKDTCCDTLAQAAHKLTDRGGLTNRSCLTVWSHTRGTHEDPSTIQVDNVADIQRRRRANASTYKKLLAAG